MIDELKKQLRKEIKLKKESLSFDQKQSLSLHIFDKLEQTPWFINAKTIMAYWAMADEVQTDAFIIKWQNEKKFILPKVEGNILVLKEFKGIESLIKDERFGIFEPSGDNFTEYNKIDMVIVPGIAFDINNNRMGRGKAFYDGILDKLTGIKVGVCFDFQLLKNVPADKHDIKMDYVISN